MITINRVYHNLPPDSDLSSFFIYHQAHNLICLQYGFFLFIPCFPTSVIPFYFCFASLFPNNVCRYMIYLIFYGFQFNRCIQETGLEGFLLRLQPPFMSNRASFSYWEDFNIMLGEYFQGQRLKSGNVCWLQPSLGLRRGDGCGQGKKCFASFLLRSFKNGLIAL